MGLPKIKNETRLIIYLVYSIVFSVYLLFQLNNLFIRIIFGFTLICYGFFGALLCYLVLKKEKLITLEGIERMEGLR